MIAITFIKIVLKVKKKVFKARPIKNISERKHSILVMQKKEEVK
jgi:hypothetical protein